MSPLHALPAGRFATPAILARLNAASRQLAELKGVASSIPNQAILVNTLGLQEAKDSSAIENIVTTHDELFRSAASRTDAATGAAKEVASYRQALRVGFEAGAADGAADEQPHPARFRPSSSRTSAGFRKLPGTVLKDRRRPVVYTPPQDPAEIVRAHDRPGALHQRRRAVRRRPARQDGAHPPPVREHPPVLRRQRPHRPHRLRAVPREAAAARHSGALPQPRASSARKPEYYRLLQTVRETTTRGRTGWSTCSRPWRTRRGRASPRCTPSRTRCCTVKHRIRARHRFYSQDLINNLFLHPYTKIDFVKDDLDVTRLTATRYLDALVADGILEKRKVGRVELLHQPPALRHSDRRGHDREERHSLDTASFVSDAAPRHTRPFARHSLSLRPASTCRQSAPAGRRSGRPRAGRPCRRCSPRRPPGRLQLRRAREPVVAEEDRHA